MKCELCGTTKREVLRCHLLGKSCCGSCYDERYEAAMLAFKASLVKAQQKAA